MSAASPAQLRELAALCQRLSTARQRALELEEQRDRLIAQLRAAGVAGSTLAESTGLSAGRIAQICNNGSPH